MQDGQISKRYGSALFSVAANFRIIDEIFNDFNKFINFCNEKLCLKEFISQTFIDKQERFEVIELLGKELFFNEYFINFLHLLIEQERIGYLPKIFTEYSNLRDNSNNVLKVKVISAKELKPEEKSKLIEMTEKAMKKTVSIKSEIDENILGGYIINIDNVLYDSSIKTRLDNFHKYLKQGAFINGN